MPAVLAGRPFGNDEDLSYVGADNVGGACMAVRYLLLDRKPGLDAVFVAPHLMAAGALRALRRSGRRVPDEVAVIGVEYSPLARTRTRS